MVSAPTPAGTTLSYGEFAFQAVGCTTSVTMTLTYPEALPMNIQFWKYGPQTALAPVSTWFRWASATLSPDRKTVKYTISDNGVGDSDPTVGKISDPFAPGFGPLVPASSIPVDAPWALASLSALIGLFAWRRRRFMLR
ncbi:IPTL-CTERM sorting domain-containing protein [Simplicispira hankyongi]|uniref:IPTL-CTERM sorting domain-containing protein n=1 Tax=Simplicispira hankyongi TaxID=2315688 RepID=UPI00319D95A6